MLSLYIATEVEVPVHGDFHVTLVFMKPQETSKLFFNLVDIMVQGQFADIVRIEYWEEANVTVAILDAEFLKDAHQTLVNKGFTYDHEFIPHITLENGNHVEYYESLIEERVYFGYSYLKIKDF